jgi:hypothetical protein
VTVKRAKIKDQQDFFTGVPAFFAQRDELVAPAKIARGLNRAGEKCQH